VALPWSVHLALTLEAPRRPAAAVTRLREAEHAATDGDATDSGAADGTVTPLTKRRAR
jgi:hypothetical protein